jgi:hypothetical protein
VECGIGHDEFSFLVRSLSVSSQLSVTSEFRLNWGVGGALPGKVQKHLILAHRGGVSIRSGVIDAVISLLDDGRPIISLNLADSYKGLFTKLPSILITNGVFCCVTRWPYNLN